jgi:hypothetical protein
MISERSSLLVDARLESSREAHDFARHERNRKSSERICTTGKLARKICVSLGD